MPGRPPLRIGQRGKINRKYLGGGVWLARTRFRDSDGVTRIVERRGPADEHDQHGKLAEDALIEARAHRRPPNGPDAIGLDTLVVDLVDQHIDRLAEDGRSVRTLDTYRYAAKETGEVHRRCEGRRVHIGAGRHRDPVHANRARRCDGGVVQDHSERSAPSCGDGECHRPQPVRDVSTIRSKSGPRGAPALTAEELRELFGKLRASDYCQRNDLVDPITICIATGLRRSELLGLRWADFDGTAGTLAVTGKG
jgi:hypothetical protein